MKSKIFVKLWYWLIEVFQIRGQYNIMDGSAFDSAIRNTELRISIRIRILLISLLDFKIPKEIFLYILLITGIYHKLELRSKTKYNENLFKMINI